YYLAEYRDATLAGLARRPRSDKGNRHDINGDMEELIRAIRLTNPDWSNRAVLEEACKMARVLGEPEPSEFHVRDIVDDIPAFIRALADGREREFGNNFKITYRLHWGGRLVLQMDWSLVDVLIKDMRAGHEGEETRPFHLLAFLPEARAVPASLFGYDRPDQFDVATLVRRALLAAELLGGQIDETSTDHGLELIAEHVHQLVKGMNINVHVCKPHHPEERGGCERFFGTLNTRLWSKERGYVGSNTVKRNPNAKATKTLAELEATYNVFLAEYHNEIHSETGETPLDFLRTHYLREPVDPRKLDLLLKERHNRKVIKTGIKYLDRLYWDGALGPLVGQHVVIRAAPAYTRP
ncbi:MAG: Mu transposase C-terminal domain-containing protein, partial [Chloroflexota bacterium]|nr:Mu transposase C-terminal domain-containing protein [Chloroflexota bacterium]